MIAAWTDKGRLYTSTRPNGQLLITDLGPAQYTAYGRSPDLTHDAFVSADYEGWYKYDFEDFDTRKLICANKPEFYESDVTPWRRYLSDNDVKIDAPCRCYLDIETDSRVEPQNAILGSARLLSFAVVDEEGHQYTGALEHDDDQAESELWHRLWNTIGQYDQVAAWYGDGFDFLVLKERSKLFTRRFPRQMKPYWEHRKRLLFIDQMACYKRHHMESGSGDEKTSLSLGAVCMALIGKGKEEADAKVAALIGKKSMGASAWKLWEAGGYYRQKLVEYNLQDTALLPELEQKTGYLVLQQALAELTFTPANTHGLSPSPQVDGYLLRRARVQQTHLISKKEPDSNAKQYEGAYVQPPFSLGIHLDVHVCDFKSLYPTIIRTFNLSPEMKETGLMQCEAFGTGVHFDSAYESMMGAFERECMELRKHYSAIYKADPNNLDANRKSKAVKILANSGYGVLGNVWFRFYDIDIARSITLSAKHMNEITAQEARARGWNVIYMDTDSLFVTGCSDDEFREFVRYCNRELYPKILAAQGVNPELACIEVDYEKKFSMLVFPLAKKGKDGKPPGPAAKRYFGKFAHYNGKQKDEPEIKGLEYKRTDGTRYGRRLQKKLIDIMLTGQISVEFYHEWVKAERAAFFEGDIDPDDIARSAAISRDLDLYKTNSPHVRLAKEMQAKGEDVSPGTRIRYITLDGRCSPKKVIPEADYAGEFDRFAEWNGIYGGVMAVLAGAFPDQNWKRWIPKRPKPVLRGQLSLLT